MNSITGSSSSSSSDTYNYEYYYNTNNKILWYDGQIFQPAMQYKLIDYHKNNGKDTNEDGSERF